MLKRIVNTTPANQEENPLNLPYFFIIIIDKVTCTNQPRTAARIVGDKFVIAVPMLIDINNKIAPTILVEKLGGFPENLPTNQNVNPATKPVMTNNPHSIRIGDILLK